MDLKEIGRGLDSHLSCWIAMADLCYAPSSRTEGL
jgi:hypothetical protein